MAIIISPKSTSIAKSFFTVGKTKTTGWYAQATRKPGKSGGFHFAGPFESQVHAAAFAVLANQFPGEELSQARYVTAEQIPQDSGNYYGAPTNAFVDQAAWVNEGGIQTEMVELIVLELIVLELLAMSEERGAALDAPAESELAVA